MLLVSTTGKVHHGSDGSTDCNGSGQRRRLRLRKLPEGTRDIPRTALCGTCFKEVLARFGRPDDLVYGKMDTFREDYGCLVVQK